ncbi:MAG: hypothetical protein AB3N23_05715 [Paracoccaceae bacterium]
MKLLASIAMLAVLLVTGVDTADLVFGTFCGDMAPFWDIIGVVPTDPRIQVVAAVMTAAISTAAWACILLAFLPLHQLIWAATLSFAFVGACLKRSAYACFGFWLGGTLMYWAIPTLLATVSDTVVLHDGVYVPVGFETTFLILSMIFLTVGQTLERAEMIEDEMNQIL